MFNNIRFVNRLAYLVWVIALTILLFSGVYYIVQNWFPIKRITIDGDVPHITKEQLSYIASHRLVGRFFTLNINDLQYEFRKIPWVNKVSVVREFPDAITVKVVEYKAIARWGEDGLLSNDGRIFNGADSDASLPIILASRMQIKDASITYNKLNELLKTQDSHNLKIQKIIYNGAGLVKVYLSNNLELILCGIDFTKNIQILNKYLDQLYQIKPNITYMNMCYKNAVAIK